MAEQVPTQYPRELGPYDVVDQVFRDALAGSIAEVVTADPLAFAGVDTEGRVGVRGLEYDKTVTFDGHAVRSIIGFAYGMEGVDEDLDCHFTNVPDDERLPTYLHGGVTINLAEGGSMTYDIRSIEDEREIGFGRNQVTYNKELTEVTTGQLVDINALLHSAQG